jgi:(p)ppGpp synthase/HD superfamily hydrolase
MMTKQNMLSQGEGTPAASGSLNRRSFAMTFPQLIDQAMALGMEEHSLVLLRRGHDLAERMVDGMYRPQGMPFITHLVRTASIVMAQGQPIEVVIAGLLHGVYLLHRFEGSRRRKARPANRAYLQREVGQAAEALVWGYAHLGWHGRKVIEEHLEKLASYGADRRSVLVIELANELEDHLDLAVLYRRHFPYRRRIEEYGNVCVNMAVRLGLPELGQALREAYDATLAHNLPQGVIREYTNAYELPRCHFWEKRLIERLASKARRAVGETLRMVGIKG